MIRFLYIVLLLSFGMATQVYAASASCLHRSEAREVQKDFEWASDHLQYRKLNYCDLNNLTRKTLSALITLNKLRFQPLPMKSLSLNVLPEIPYQFFKARVRRIVFEARGSAACPVEYQNGVAVSWLSAFVTHEDRTMHICELAGRLDHYDFAQLLIHEARHVDGKKFDHIACERGHFAKSTAAACDTQLEDLGSYAVGIEFNLKLSYSTQVNPLVRRTARRQALKDLSARFNILPLDMQEGALLQNMDGTLSFFNGDSLQRIQPTQAPDSLLVRHFELPMLYNLSPEIAETTVHFVYPFVVTENPPLPQVEDPVRLLLRKNPTAELLDVIHQPALTCYLLSTKISCHRISGETLEIDFARIRPQRLLSTTSSFVADASNISILDQDGTLYELPKTFDFGGVSNEASLVAKPFPWNAVRMDAWTGISRGSYDILVLSRDGELKGFSSVTKSLQPLPVLQGLKFKDMISPYFYSPKLQEL